MTTHDKDKIIAAAKEAGAKFDPAWGLAYNCGTETFIRFYSIAFENGRQAEREKQIQEVSNAKNKTN